MAPEAPLAEVVDPDLGKPLLPDPARDALAERPLQHRREEGQEVDPHFTPPRPVTRTSPERIHRPSCLAVLRRPCRGGTSVVAGAEVV